MNEPGEGSATLRVALLTVSDTRGSADDESGRILADGFLAAGFDVIARRRCPDGEETVRQVVEELLGAHPHAVVLTGGSGLAPRDRTPEAVVPLLDRQLPGFGELFRQLSYRDVGTRSLASRALAGQVGSTLVFLLPGSPKACRLALEEILVPELPHLARMVGGGAH